VCAASNDAGGTNGTAGERLRLTEVRTPTPVEAVGTDDVSDGSSYIGDPNACYFSDLSQSSCGEMSGSGTDHESDGGAYGVAARKPPP